MEKCGLGLFKELSKTLNELDLQQGARLGEMVELARDTCSLW